MGKIDLNILKNDFDDDVVNSILELTLESVENNIKLINKGLKSKNQKEIFRGCHTLKSLGFLGADIFVVKKSTILTHIVRDREFIDINLELFNKILSEFIEEAEELKVEIIDIISKK